MLNARNLRENLSFMRGNILVMTITRVLGMFTRQMVFPYASLFVLALGGDPKEIGIVNSLRPLLGLLVFPIAGYLTDRTGRVRLIAWGGYFSSAVLLLYVLAPSWQVLAFAGLLQGLLTLQFPPTSALLADSLEPKDRGKGIATMNSLSGILAMASPYIAGVLLDSYGDETGMRILYASMMVIYLASAIINHRFLKETSQRSEERVRLADLPRVIRDTYSGVPAMIRRWPPALRALTVIIGLGLTANAISGGFWVVYAKEEIGLSAKSWGLILLIETFLRNVTYIPGGLLVDRLGRTKFVVISLLISMVSIPLIVFVNGFGGALMVRGAIAVANALFSPACSALVADTVPRDMRGRVMAAIGQGQMLLGSSGGGTGGPGMGFLMTLPVIAGSLVGGYLYDTDPRLPWFFTFAALAVCVMLAWRRLCDPPEACV